MPLLVGGTLLYLRALRDGLSALPRADREVRAELDREAAQHGWSALHERLRRLDPAAAAADCAERPAAHPARARGARADRAADQRAATRGTTRARRGGLGDCARAGRQGELGARIERRFDAMVAHGFVAEVERLRARGDLRADLPSMRAVGYRQIWSYLDGDYGWDEARAKAIVATRQYAKRQLTWLRGDPELRSVAGACAGASSSAVSSDYPKKT